MPVSIARQVVSQSRGTPAKSGFTTAVQLRLDLLAVDENDVLFARRPHIS
jgi:hypothetical protein